MLLWKRWIKCRRFFQEVKDIIAKGEKLAAEAKAPEFLAKVKTSIVLFVIF